MADDEKKVFTQDPKVYGKASKPEPIPQPQIGIDTNNTILKKIAEDGGPIGAVGGLDINLFNGFTNTAQSRESIYSMIDNMCQDSIITAILDTYTEDATETNSQGQIVWAESADPEVTKYVTYLLDTMNVDKYIYKWTYCLIKYGDTYLRLYRKSDMEEDDVLADESKNQRQMLKESVEDLKENVNIIAYSPDDSYTHYVELVDNPATMFELTKYSKTYMYVSAEITSQGNIVQDAKNTGLNYLQYKFNKNDVDIHGPTDYVHASLQDTSSRTPEKVDIFISDPSSDTPEKEKSSSYTVKRGQPLLYNVFKIWRMLSLLENSVMLNRLTKSTITRIIKVEVGDMDKSMVAPHLEGIKALMEQKAALDTTGGYNEYTNPGPVENNIYVATRNGIGALSSDTLGGDVNVRDLADLEYLQDKFFGSVRIPKQYFGIVKDNAGFSGGQSLSIISSRYAKAIKRIQNTMLQALTDAINLMLIDKGMNNRVNKFTLRMQEPTTQEETDRNNYQSTKIGNVSSILSQLGGISDPAVKLEITKTLLSDCINNGDVINIIQKQIDAMEQDENKNKPVDESVDNNTADSFGSNADSLSNLGSELGLGSNFEDQSNSAETTQPPVETSAPETTNTEEPLPSPADLGEIDFSNNNNF